MSMLAGLLLGGIAATVGYCSTEPFARWSLLIAAAVELGFVPCYTNLASRRLRYRIALIELDLEEGFVGDSNGRVGTLFGVWPVLQDVDTRRVRLARAGRANLAAFRPGTVLAYRFGLRSGVVLSVEFHGYGDGSRAEPSVGARPETLDSRFAEDSQYQRRHSEFFVNHETCSAALTSMNAAPN
jgi:hypothetical protein